MTFDEEFLLINPNKSHFINSFNNIKDYIINNKILDNTKSIIDVPSKEYTLKELYNLSKNNYFELNKIC
jgi:hypothetical protein